MTVIKATPEDETTPDHDYREEASEPVGPDRDASRNGPPGPLRLPRELVLRALI